MAGRDGPMVLVLDDDVDSVITLAHMLREGGFRPGMATGQEKALGLLRDLPYRLIISDLWMPEGDGLAFLKAAREIRPGIPAILITARGDWDTYMDALNDGVAEYMQKPVRKAELLEMVTRTLAAVPAATVTEAPTVTF